MFSAFETLKQSNCNCNLATLLCIQENSNDLYMTQTVQHKGNQEREFRNK